MSPLHPKSPSRRRGFTLTELIVASTLSAIIMAGILSTVLMIGRSGYALGSYIDMEAQSRVALERFSLDARSTRAVTWTRADATDPASALVAIALTKPDNSVVIYAYNTSTPGNFRLTRTVSGGPTVTLIQNIRTCTFTAYKYLDTSGAVAINAATTPTAQLQNETKMVQISLSALRSRATTANTTNTVVSARFMLRNKKIT